MCCYACVNVYFLHVVCANIKIAINVQVLVNMSDNLFRFCLPFLGSNGGVCDTNTFACTCTSEWSGAACDQPVCNSGAGCGQQGTCIINASDLTHQCNCTSGWTGPTCDTAVCARDTAGVECSGHGMCQTSSGTPTCVCFADYTGVACEITAAQAFSAAPTVITQPLTQQPALTDAQGN